jgi:hypothetical protein
MYEKLPLFWSRASSDSWMTTQVLEAPVFAATRFDLTVSRDWRKIYLDGFQGLLTVRASFPFDIPALFPA